ncbi:CBN-HSR-9 protein, partial [Aphelenchoides avenae]
MQVDSPSSSTGRRFRQQPHISGAVEGDTPAAVAFSVRTPARQTPQQLPTSTTTKKRGTAAGMHPPGTDVHPPLKRQRRNKKDSQPAKVESMHDKPPVLAPVTEADNEVIVNDAQSKKDQNAPSSVGFTKVHVQKQSPGTLRNTSTPRSGSSKYQKTATERQAEDVPAAISPLVSTPLPAEKYFGQPASEKKSAAVKLSSSTGIARERKSQLSDTITSTAKAEVNLSEKRKSKPESDQQATSSVRRGATRARVPVLSGTPVTKKKMDVPEELSAVEQLSVDHPDQEHCMIPRGARVFAQYAQAFYPAIICTDDGLSRYSICFIEDGITKPVPNDSVFLLSKLVPGVTTMISPSPDDLGPNVVGREIEVVAVPDSKNGEEWKEGKFKVRDTETGEESTVLWTQFYFRKQDADALKPKQKAMPLVKESNIVLESRTSHRSRAAFNHSVAELPKALTTTIPLARRSRPSTGKKEDLDKTQLASTSRDVLNETPVNEEKLDKLTGST